jgi:hypothetical protein
MGNHEITCEFCGQDRRITKPICCEAYQQHAAAKEAALASQYRAQEKVLEEHGIKYSHNSMGKPQVDIEDILAKINELSHRVGIR